MKKSVTETQCYRIWTTELQKYTTSKTFTSQQKDERLFRDSQRGIEDG